MLAARHGGATASAGPAGRAVSCVSGAAALLRRCRRGCAAAARAGPSPASRAAVAVRAALGGRSPASRSGSGSSSTSSPGRSGSLAGAASFAAPPSAPADSSGEEAAALAALAASIALGALLGGVAGVGLDPALPGDGVQRLSAALGWSYFACWTASFWPQIIENHRTRDVSGLSPDYLLYSLLGFVCYSAYTAALYFSDDVRASYAAIHGGAAPDVSVADFAFAAHAVAATLAVSAQYAWMRVPGQDRGVSPIAAAVGVAVAAACAGSAGHISATCDAADCAAWLPMLVLLGGTKVLMTCIKYTPQVLHNHARRSTEGWNLTNVLLDLGGGTLSLAQVLLDAVARHDMSLITGSPAKLWIAALSIGYDLIFVAQHYVLYAGDGARGGKHGGKAAPAKAAPAPAPLAAAPRGGAALAFAQVGRRWAGAAPKEKL
ncbi:hypothetical protein Rsub_01132 [Raphidocelis subcapitata]|uniref:Cystinosin n=1 Tax=Raphidocelis subcapitata TaxID=307507 RepID=A0A2V0NS70_9CHLO|nr:hypothetical protein Rsub_01132 [Raphidocelis subcapitata]|eukprot:GBF88420.1 hypothetical protein Rsub_01132 [Raphidocelis subcapitata]